MTTVTVIIISLIIEITRIDFRNNNYNYDDNNKSTNNSNNI